jgi:Fic family protein
MDELIEYMNKDDGTLPLIKAAIIHSQFESIHPFDDGNGRVGRLLISLYFYKAKLINFPFFYISEAFGQEKTVYYNKLTDSRTNSFTEWIRFFLRKCIVQAQSHIKYIDSLNELYEKTKIVVKESLRSPTFEAVTECLFTQPVLTASYLSGKLNISAVQAKRYLDTLEAAQVLQTDDRQRYKRFFFVELLDLALRV